MRASRKRKRPESKADLVAARSGDSRLRLPSGARILGAGWQGRCANWRCWRRVWYHGEIQPPSPARIMPAPPDDRATREAARQAELESLALAEVPLSPTPSPVVIDRGRSPSPEYAWHEIGGMIALAGGAFPAILATILLPYALYVLLGAAAEEGIFPIAVLALTFVAYLVFACFAAMFVTGFVTFPMLVVIALSLRLLQWRPALDRLGTFCGGAVAMVFATPILSWAAQGLFLEQYPRHPATFVLLGLAALVIFVAQLGGAIGGVNLQHAAGQKIAQPTPSSELRTTRPQFSIAQIMAVTLIVSLALTVLRVTGLLRGSVFLALGIWTVLMLAGMRPAIWLARKRLLLFERLSRKRRLKFLRRRPSVEKRKAAVEYWRANRQARRQRWGDRDVRLPP